MKQSETNFKMIELILDSRNISAEDRESMGIIELLKKNQDLNKEDFEFNENKLSDIDLVKMLENNYLEKKKIFDSKKQFMVYIGDLKVQHKKQLSELFDELNKVEDEYTILQQVIKNLRTAINLNKTELNSLKKKLQLSKKEEEDLKALDEQYQKETEDKKY